ncbi:unnamed protein product [marine sediment metagenome]|uniref:Uncharacterized protein n=1 Tax=marine sediment metagenome TaxID=412755 RepID=X1LQ18_9ZZZZ
MTRNLLNTRRIPEIILLMPRRIGLKNIIRVSKTADSFLSPINPGTIIERI